MARKTLLTENELRQFMKLANLTPIGQVKLSEFGYNDLDEQEAPPGELEDYAAGDLERGHPGEAAADEEEAGLEMGDDELDAEAGLEDMGAEEGGAGMVSVDDFMSALESALEDVLGEPVSTEMDDEIGAEDDLEGGEMDMEMDVEAGPDELEVTASSEEGELPGSRSMYEGKTQEDIVNEVARRVAARLQKEDNKSAMVDQLAERILKRLTK
jgi:hypothetical protein